MGMDLVPREADDSIHWNWSGWDWFNQALKRWGIVVQLAGSNDGDVIPAETCVLIADAIDAHADEYNAAFAGEYHGPDPASKHAKAFRVSGGMAQW